MRYLGAIVAIASCSLLGCTAAPFETNLAVLVDPAQEPFAQATMIDIQLHYAEGDPIHGEIDPVSGAHTIEGLREGTGVVIDIIARDAGDNPVAMGRSQPFDVGQSGGDATVFVGVVDSLARIEGGLVFARAFSRAAYAPGDRVVVVGGGDNAETVVDDVEFFGWNADTPVHGMDGASLPRMGHALVTVPAEVGGPWVGQILALGGTPAGGVDHLEDTWNQSLNTIVAIDPVTGMVDDDAGELEDESALFHPVWTDDGQLALIGGFRSAGSYFEYVRLIDPEDLSESTGPDIDQIREQHRIVELEVSGDRMVLISGGITNGTGPLASLELWNLDPSSSVDPLEGIEMTDPRLRHTATALAGGRVLLAGGSVDAANEYGQGTSTTSADIYDALFNSLTPTPTPMQVPRQRHVAAALDDHRVLVCAGENSEGTPLSSCEVYDDSIGQGEWLPFTGGALSPGGPGVTAVPFPDGRILFFGGASAVGPDDTVHIYTPMSLGSP